MMMYNIEFIRRVPGRDEPEVVDVHNMMAFSLEQVIHCAALSLRTITFRVTPETFRIRQNGGQIVYAPPARTLVIS